MAALIGLLRFLLPWLIVALIIVVIWLAIGIGNELGQGITEWHLP